jgi:KipI family sensor histidine kinase inhibitor
MDVRFLPAGDTALVVEFGDRVERALSDRVLQLSRQIDAARLPGVVESVPTFRSLMVHYDPAVTDGERLMGEIRARIGQIETMTRRRRLWRLPACYAPGCAPDLASVAERTGLAPREVIHRHAQTQFHVYMIGFTPGCPYMGDLPAELSLPRRVDPRMRVPTGSIAIAAGLSIIYPVESPGGWHLIGATPVRLFDPRWEKPSLLAPGDAVRFEPIGLDGYEAIRAAALADRYRPVSEDINA